MVVTLIAGASLPPNTAIKLAGTIRGAKGETEGSFRLAPLWMNPGERLTLRSRVLKLETGQAGSPDNTRRSRSISATDLPEGSYTFYPAVLEFYTGRPLSDPNPSNCSTVFEIQSVVDQCACISSPVITKTLEEGNRWAYEASGTFGCAGFCGPGPEVTQCGRIGEPSFSWMITSGGDVAEIDGAADGAGVTVLIKKSGPFVIAVHTTTTCSCATCDGFAGKEETVPETPPSCVCTIDSKQFGGPPIKIISGPQVYELAETGNGQAVGLSVVASDNDVLLQKCILGGIWEKLIDPVPDVVTYAWTVESPAGVTLAGADAGAALLVLPYHLNPGEKWEAAVRCDINSANDEMVTGRFNITVTGKDTCENFDVVVTHAGFEEKTGVVPTPAQAGLCVPQPENWVDNAPLSAGISAFGKNVQLGQATYLSVSATDLDGLILSCKSDNCGNPTKTLPMPDVLKYAWDDGGAGGTFVPDATGAAVIYIAPDKTGTVKITCTVDDKPAGVDDPAKPASIDITVRDILTEMNSPVPPTSANNYFTAGIQTTFKPTWATPEAVHALVSEWCLDLGGTTGKVEALGQNADGLDPNTAALRFSPTLPKDDGLNISWKQHTHLHGKYTLHHRLTFQFKEENLVFTDEKWDKSDFLEGLNTDEYKLFFDADKNSARKDDGKWRGNAAQDEDKYGPAATYDSKNVPEWFLHWAENTYDPCNKLEAAFKFDLTRTDPKFVYVPAINNALTPHAEYKWQKSENIVEISDMASTSFAAGGYKFSGYAFVTSDMKKKVIDIELPAIQVAGLECFTKVLSHELSHWLSIHKNWSAGGEWTAKYGEHAFSRPWKEVYNAKLIDLAKVKDYPKTWREFNGKVIKLMAPNVSMAGVDAADKFNLVLEVAVDVPRSAIKDKAVVEISRGWFAKGDASGKNFLFYAEHDAIQKVTYTDNQGAAPIITIYNSKNGFVLERKGSNKFAVYERHNDIDGDWVPNLAEDEMGATWLAGLTHNGAYHGKPNDQEFWAEWRSKQLIDPA
ncbi:MAG: hypothetical protein L6Q97_02955, partial [Thermoanaerobaculia bacterium]|nr:hypothetical protein [Thermoanaerobaculia bacterium]